MINLKKQLESTKKASFILGQILTKEKNQILSEIIKSLKRNKKFIIDENKKDIKNALKNKLSDVFINRLTITDKIFLQITAQVEQIIKLPNPIGRSIEEKKLKNGINLKKISVPIGVLGVIYEARPNVTADAAALAIKSGNAVVLKGGSNAINSNRAIAKCIREALVKTKISTETVLFLDTLERKIVDKLLTQNKFIDVIIPRGGYNLVNKVVKNSRIPVLYHAEGGARIYIDEFVDLDEAVKICENAKISRPSVCNSLDTIVVNNKIVHKFLKRFSQVVKKNKIEIMADNKVCKIIKNAKIVNQKDFETEFLSLKLSIKTVNNLDEAIEFINEYSNKHSEGIISNNKKNVDKFIKSIDAAAIFVNCSTRFHDGGEFEMGAEMGIATGKLHARGPVGLRELTTYKWIAYGDGQVR